MKKLRQAEKALVDRRAGGNGDVSVTQSTEILLAFEFLRVQLCLALTHGRAEKKGCDAIDTYTTHADLVHYVTDTDCQPQNGCPHSHVFTIFKR